MNAIRELLPSHKMQLNYLKDMHGFTAQEMAVSREQCHCWQNASPVCRALLLATSAHPICGEDEQ